MSLLKAKKLFPSSSSLSPLHPFLDSNDRHSMCWWSREQLDLSYSRCYPMILHGKHPISKLIIRSEHLRLLHAGPTLLLASLSHRFHVVYLRKTVRSITRQCVTCQRQTVRPQPQMMGQLPLESVIWHAVSNKNHHSLHPGLTYISIPVSIFGSRFLSLDPGFYLSLPVCIFRSRFVSFAPGLYLSLPVSI